MADIPAVLLRPFDLANLPWSGGRVSEKAVRQRRTALGGQLFIDRLLAFADIDGPALYPPSGPSGLRRLLGAILESDVDRLKRDCFVYYLARDADAAAPENEGGMEVDDAASSASSPYSRASEFARARCLPRTWRTYMDGYWHLDHGDWDAAVDCLRDPCLRDVDFASEIVAALTTQVSPPSHALALAHAFLSPRASAGKITDQIQAEAALLGETSVAGMAAAFDAIRTLPAEAERDAAREAVWCWSLGAPRSPAGKGPHTAQPRALRELLHLALSDEEHAHLVSFLAHPPREISPPARSLLHDLVTLRLVHAGKYEETLALDRELAGTDSALAADRQRRREMVREFIDILPAAQRRILLGDRLTNGDAEDVDMGGSWVDVAKEDDERKEKEQEEREKAKAEKAQQKQIPAAPAPFSTPIAAPAPIRAPAVRNLQQSVPARPSSPFGGPPRFPASPAVATPRPAASGSGSPPRSAIGASTPSPPSPEPVATPRVASTPAPAPAVPASLRASPPRTVHASPFRAPASTAKPAPRKPKKVIDDTPRKTKKAAAPEPATAPPPKKDETPRRSSRRRVEDEEEALIRAPSEPPIPEDAPAPEPKPARRSRRTIAPPAPKPEPEDPPKRATRVTRASTAEVDDEPPIPGSFTASTRRNAAKASLEEPEPAPEPKRAKSKATATRRTTRAMSEAMSEADEVAPVAARTRRAAAASERGSPTPSVASSAASPPRTRRTRQTSATPRATRSRKAKE